MKVLVALVFLWSFLSPALGSSVHSPKVQFAGQDYASLGRWAEARQFSLEWLNDTNEVQLSNRSSKVRFRANSTRAEVNGIAVFLSFPIMTRQSEAFISLLDLSRMLEPVLVPSKNQGASKTRIQTVALCAGHGGKDNGYQTGSHREKDYTLRLAKDIERRLKAAGLRVVHLRDTDEYVDIYDRPKIAKRKGAQLYISLHYNSAGEIAKDVKGVEMYCLPPAGASSTSGGTERTGQPLPGNRYDEQNILLAYQLQKSLVNNLGLADRGVRRARFVVLRDAEMPAVLVEAGFMSNPEELKRIIDSKHREKTAQAVVDGILAYKRLMER